MTALTTGSAARVAPRGVFVAPRGVSVAAIASRELAGILPKTGRLAPNSAVAAAGAAFGLDCLAGWLVTEAAWGLSGREAPSLGTSLLDSLCFLRRARPRALAASAIDWKLDARSVSMGGTRGAVEQHT